MKDNRKCCGAGAKDQALVMRGAQLAPLRGFVGRRERRNKQDSRPEPVGGRCHYWSRGSRPGLGWNSFCFTFVRFQVFGWSLGRFSSRLL